VFLVCGTLLYTARHEGYWPHISVLFWIVLAIGMAVGLWATTLFSTQRMVAIAVVAFTVEYVKEALGIETGAWRYAYEQFSFGVWAWVLATLTCCALAVGLVVKIMVRLRIAIPRWVGPTVMLGLGVFIPATMGAYRGGTNLAYWSLYAVLVAVCVLGARRMGSNLCLAVVLGALALGFPYEYASAINSGI